MSNDQILISITKFQIKTIKLFAFLVEFIMKLTEMSKTKLRFSEGSKQTKSRQNATYIQAQLTKKLFQYMELLQVNVHYNQVQIFYQSYCIVRWDATGEGNIMKLMWQMGEWSRRFLLQHPNSDQSLFFGRWWNKIECVWEKGESWQVGSKSRLGNNHKWSQEITAWQWAVAPFKQVFDVLSPPLTDPRMLSFVHFRKTRVTSYVKKV